MNPFEEIDEARLRNGSGVKWASVDADVTPAWVADMDFGVPDAVLDAIRRATDAQDFGYPFHPGGDPLVTTFEKRMESEFGWRPQDGRTRVFSDLIQILQVTIEHATRRGSGVALHVPNYPPFLASIERSGRRVIPIAARRTTQTWRFDHDDLEARLRAADCRLLVIVNPHNPTGRVLTRAELQELADIAERLDLTVLSDEIHADLTRPGHQHIPFASLSEDAANRTITATSATKAFNIAGLRCAIAHVGDARLERSLARAPLDFFGQPNGVGRAATIAAWTEAEAWREQLRQCLEQNHQEVALWASAHPELDRVEPEATYLHWIDFRRTRISAAPARAILERGRVLLSAGDEFSQHTSEDTTSFARLNVATSPRVLRRALTGIELALR